MSLELFISRGIFSYDNCAQVDILRYLNWIVQTFVVETKETRREWCEKGSEKSLYIL